MRNKNLKMVKTEITSGTITKQTMGVVMDIINTNNNKILSQISISNIIMLTLIKTKTPMEINSILSYNLIYQFRNNYNNQNNSQQDKF